jgi:cyclic pyranopterin phosphate synthase
LGDDDFFAGRSLARAKADRLGKTGAGTGTGRAEGAGPAPRRGPLPAEAEGRMVDIGAKPVVPREAVAEGFLRLKPETLRAVAEGRAPKGDPYGPARVAGILAAKMTPQLVPFCHPIPLSSIDVVISQEAAGVRVRATVRTQAQTGVEMEALAAATNALLTVWDMTKALEKDASGNYPTTTIESVRVVSKTKGAAR